MRLYVVAKMGGLRHFNYPAITAAGEALEEAGYEVLTPIDEDPPDVQRAALNSDTGDWDDLPISFTLTDAIRLNVETVISVDGIAILGDITTSKGARMEVAVAERLGLPVAPVEWWIEHL